MKLKIKVGSVVQWRGRTWAVTKVGRSAVVLTAPEDMSTTAVAFRNEVVVLSTPRG